MNLWIYPTALAVLVGVEFLYFRIAGRLNIIDRPNLRSSHTHITLRGGGIIFLIGTWLYCSFCGMHYPWFMAGLTAICAVSFADDVHSVPNSWRLLVHFASMMLMFVDLGIINPHLWWAVIAALVVCVGIINAFNFMDGINGITGAYSLAVLIPLAVLNHWYSFVDQRLLIFIAMAVLAFCFFNFRKRARCFAGDVGAVGIAFILLFVLGRLIIVTGDIQYLLLMGVYGIDTVLTIVHRIILHEHLGQAHRKHAYQIMANELRISHTTVSILYFAIQLAVSAGLIAIPNNFQWPYAIAVLLLLASAYLIFMKKYYHLHEEYLASKHVLNTKKI